MNDEKRLINALKSNNRENIETVFEYIFNNYKSYVAFVASMYLKDRHDIDDIIQDVLSDFLIMQKMLILQLNHTYQYRQRIAVLI